MAVKKTVVDQIEITSSGVIQVRMRKLLVDDDGVEHELGYHRTSIAPGEDVDFVMGEVNKDLVRMKMAEVEDQTTLKSIIPVIHTTQKVDAYKASIKK